MPAPDASLTPATVDVDLEPLKAPIRAYAADSIKAELEYVCCAIASCASVKWMHVATLVGCPFLNCADLCSISA